MVAAKTITCAEWAAVFDGQTSVKEPPAFVSEIPSETDTAKFLLYMDFNDFKPDALYALTRILAETVYTGKVCIKEICLDIAGSAPRVNALVSSIGYYAEKNYDSVRAAAYKKYGVQMPKDFEGTKNFINRLSIIYSLYYLPEMKARPSQTPSHTV